MANIIGTDGNDTLVGNYEADTINGKAGDDTFITKLPNSGGNDTLTGGSGKDKFVFDNYTGSKNNIITDFGGVGKGTDPTAEVIAEADTLEFQGNVAQNLLLIQNGNNLEIRFAGESNITRFYGPLLILQNFALSNLDNLSKSTGASVDLGNIVFEGQTSATDSFDVFNADSTQSTIFNKNTVTFLNDLNNNVSGFDESDDVINGQGGDDIINGLGGNDLLRGGAGDDTLVGGAGDDTLVGGIGSDSPTGNNFLAGGTGNDYLNVEYSTGNNTLNGGDGDDTLSAGATSGNNFLSGGDGNDSLYASYIVNPIIGYYSSSNNTLEGGAGDDTLNAQSESGNNFLSGGDGNDSLDTSGVIRYRSSPNFSSSGNNTLNGGAGDDTLRAEYSTGNNLLSGGDGNDFLSTSGIISSFNNYASSSSNNTLNGGAGDDTLKAEYSSGNNFLSGGDGNDSFYLNPASPNQASSSLVTQTVDGGKDDDLLWVDYALATAGITTTFNATTNSGEITAGTYRVNYKNIERLDILGTGYDDNIVGNSGNDSFSTGTGGKDTIDGGEGDDLLYVNYSNTSEGITTTFNTNTNIGEITAGSNLVTYKNIERLNILGTNYDDNIVGNDSNDTLSGGNGGNDIIDGGEGDDLLVLGDTIDYSNTAWGITTTFNANTSIGEITAGSYRVNYKNIERLNIPGTRFNDNIVGNDGDDTLSKGNGGDDTLDGGAGNDVLIAGNKIVKGSSLGGSGNTTLTGGAGNDQFFSELDSGTDIITDFGGVGKGSNPSATVIASSDTLQFRSSTPNLSTAQNLLLTQNGNNLEITFEGYFNGGKVILQNFKLEDLDNLPATSSRPAIGNLLFYEETTITDSFDVFDADSTQTTLFNRNTVTFLNDLDNNITGFDNSNDVINGQGGDDIIDGLSGDDLLRGGTGNDTLNGGAGNDILNGGVGNNSLNGGAGNDSLSASDSKGNNLLSGGDGNDSLDVSVYSYSSNDTRSEGNNTLEGGAGNDTLSAGGSTGNNLLSGGDGNDVLTASYASGKNILRGGSGNDVLIGGDGNDSLYAGDGTDTFGFYNYNGGVDTIYDFNAANELIQVSAAGFGGGLSIGSLSPDQFTIGASATTSEQLFIYNSATGSLFFDQDGSGSGFAQVEFAQLSTGLSLTKDNFVVV